MFIYNILTGGSSSSAKQQAQKYDKINFKINLSDNIPQFYQTTSENIRQETEITSDHPLYGKIFGHASPRKASTNSLGNLSDGLSKDELVTTESVIPGVEEGFLGEDQRDYCEYKTDENDTLIGIAMKLDISEKTIRSMNGISGRIYPGMTIKLPKGLDLSKLSDEPEVSAQKTRISKLLGKQQSNIETKKIEAEYYAGAIGYIKGHLSLNKNYLIFNPSLDDQKNLQSFSVQKLLKFNAIVETADIQDVNHMDVPQMSEENSENPEHEHIVKIFLYTVGNNKIEKKYKERLRKLKIEQKSIASIEFSLKCHGQSACQESEQLVQSIKTVVSEYRKENPNCASASADKRQQKRLTNIPFFDIIHENIHPKIKEQMQEEIYYSQPTEEMSPSKVAILGMLNDHSDIITDTQFQNLARKLPILYQLSNWDRLYSSTHNGSSFVTFLNKAKGQWPVILFVKEYKGYSFGAFMVEPLETGKTGRGEMFIFTYRNNSDVPQIYHWTSKNEFFVYIDTQSGIGIGMGLKYALFLRHTLDKGSSASSYTFGNEDKLSKKEDFTIEEVELWGMDSSY